MKFNTIKRTIITSAFGVITLAGASAVSAQNPNEEYREWQEAQRRAQEEYRDYQRTGRRADYRDWQQAQREAQREYADYQRVSRNRGWNNGWNNNSRWNNRRMYRVYRDGRYYETDYRGAELLRQAVNRGYQQGYNAGLNDRRYGRDSYYYDSSVYRNGTYGYQSYVARDQYQYYFQEGFERGYQDGYNSTTRYGYRSGNTFNILSGVLNTILQIADND